MTTEVDMWRFVVQAQEKYIIELETAIWRAAWQPMCADCRGPAETQWRDGTHLCYGCAYGRAGWESP